MGSKSTKGVRIVMSKAGVVPATVVATAVTAAKPAVVTVSSTSGMVEGNPVTVTGTSMASLDGKTFIVSGLDGTHFTLLGSDATPDSAATSGTFGYWDDTELTTICASDITVNPETSSPVATPTFCDPTQQVAGQPAAAGTLVMPLYIDKDDEGYHELIAAESDAVSRQFSVIMPDNGYMVFAGVIQDLNWSSFPIEGAITRDATVALNSRPVHRF